MKSLIKAITLILLVNCFLLVSLNAQVAINADGSNPDASAMLEITSSEKGILIPRMTSTQRTDISSPATGLLVFDTETGSFWFYNGTTWKDFSGVADADPTNEIELPTGGTDGQVLKTDGNGNYDWVNQTVDSDTDNQTIDKLNLNGTTLEMSLEGDGQTDQTLDLGELQDNLGNHIVTQNIQTSNFYLSNDGGNEGIWIDETGQVGIGMSAPTDLLHVPLENTTSQLIINNSDEDLQETGSNVWQSYTSTINGILDRIEIPDNYYDSPDITITIYEGEGTSGTNLGTKTVGSSGGAWRFNLSSLGIEQIAGNKYSFKLSGYGGLLSANESYSGGRSSIYKNTDLAYRLFATEHPVFFSAGTNGVIISDYTLPTVDGMAGQVIQTDGSGQLNWVTVTEDVFTSENGLTRSLNNNDDFVFGADSLNRVSGKEVKFFFDKSTGAFRAGSINNDDWNQDSLGIASIAMGENPKATGLNAIAMGYETYATGRNATAIGEQTLAAGQSSIALGFNTKAQGDYSIAVGNGSIASAESSVAFGEGTIASEVIATAFGANTKASGSISTAFGDGTEASGYASTAGGDASKASGNYATAFGFETLASKESATTFGSKTKATGTTSTAFGSLSQATGATSTAFGFKTLATGNFSTAFGAESKATGIISTAFGDQAEANGDNSTAFGSLTKAKGLVSTAFGYLSEADGAASTAFGYGAQTSGVGATAFGYATKAIGNVSTAMGEGTTAISYGEVVLGLYNTEYRATDTTDFNSADRLLVVGNGTTDDNRSDALILYKNGNADLNGALTIDSAYTFPTIDGTTNQVLTTDGKGTLSWTNGKGAFITSNGITSSVNHDDVFVFGVDSLNYGEGTEHKMYFDKSSGSFRVGGIDNVNWNRDSVGAYSFATGYSSKASGSTSTAFGFGVQATGFASTAFGSGTKANGKATVAFGFLAQANADYATAFGEATIANGELATAFGKETQADGNQSTAFGYRSKANGPSSTVFGHSTKADGFYATAFGEQTAATGRSSVAMGIGTAAISYGEVALGSYNTKYQALDTIAFDSTDRLLVIGNGIDADNRSDALVVYKNGNLEIGGWLSADGDDEGILIDDSGKMGIGEGNPDTKLHVTGGGAPFKVESDENDRYFTVSPGGGSIDMYNSFFNLNRFSTEDVVLVRGGGNVGIGEFTTTAPAYKLTVNGEPAANGFTQFTNYSDRRLKHNIQNVSSALDRITQLRPVSFQYNAKTGYDSTALATTFKGFIAQELQAIFPEMVGKIELNDETYLDANLSSLPIYLVKAIQEQQITIEELNKKMTNLESENEELKMRLREIENLKKQNAEMKIIFGQIQAQLKQQ